MEKMSKSNKKVKTCKILQQILSFMLQMTTLLASIFKKSWRRSSRSLAFTFSYPPSVSPSYPPEWICLLLFFCTVRTRVSKQQMYCSNNGTYSGATSIRIFLFVNNVLWSDKPNTMKSEIMCHGTSSAAQTFSMPTENIPKSLWQLPGWDH